MRPLPGSSLISGYLGDLVASEVVAVLFLDNEYCARLYVERVARLNE